MHQYSISSHTHTPTPAGRVPPVTRGCARRKVTVLGQRARVLSRQQVHARQWPLVHCKVWEAGCKVLDVEALMLFWRAAAVHGLALGGGMRVGETRVQGAQRKAGVGGFGVAPEGRAGVWGWCEDGAVSTSETRCKTHKAG